MSKRWVKEQKRETYYKAAKKQGYRARSAFKLIQIGKRFDIFKKVFTVLDLGCAPGSWLQVTSEYIYNTLQKSKSKTSYKIMGVDLAIMSPIENVFFLRMDIHNEKLEENINKFFENKKIDLVLSDCSINKTGNKTHDQIIQMNICKRVLEIAEFGLKKGGTLLLKCFEGSEVIKFVEEVEKSFHNIKKFIPQATRTRSNELFLVCKSKKE